MATRRIEAFNDSLRRNVRPALIRLGFKVDSRCRTFRRPSGNCTQIINFQAGVRSLEGRFAVNLAIYHPLFREDAENTPAPEKPRDYDCLLRERLSILRDTWLSRIARRFVSEPDTLIKWWLVTPGDHWWRLSEDPAVMDAEVHVVLDLLLTRGIRWLDEHATEEALRRVAQNLRRVTADS